MAHVQTVSTTVFFADPATTSAITTTSGNSIAAGYHGYDSDTITFTDSKSNSYTANSASPQSNIGFSAVYGARKLNITGGSSHTFTASSGIGSQVAAFIVSEFSGRDTTTLDDQDGNTQASGTTTHAGPAMTCTTGADIWAIIGFWTQDPGALTLGAWTIPTNGDQSGFYHRTIVIYKNNVSSGSNTPSITSANATIGNILEYSFASASSTQSYSYSAAGGIVFGGTAARAKVLAKTPAGGIVVGGTSTVLKKVTRAAAGGVNFGGTAAFAKGKQLTASGGVQFAGGATQIRVRVPAPAGGLNLSGAASLSFHGQYSYTAQGGLVFGGTTTKVRVHVTVSFGGIIFGGTTTMSSHESTRTVAALGGVVLSGAALASFYSAGAPGSTSGLIRDQRRRGFVSTLWGRS